MFEYINFFLIFIQTEKEKRKILPHILTFILFVLKMLSVVESHNVLKIASKLLNKFSDFLKYIFV